ncbi:MAG: phosphatase PAP2 family protein [Fibrobacter sp.]|nr:phosphatase PAP2 family protein [Fibrobacter sp.]
MLQSLIQFDSGLFILINSHNNVVLDWVFWLITQLGNGWIVVPVLIGVIWVKTPRSQVKKVLICGLLSIAISGIVNTQLKLLVKRPRPISYYKSKPYDPSLAPSAPKDFPTERLYDSVAVHIVGPALKRNSFPSGHTNLAFSASVLLIFLYGGVFWTTLIPASLVAYSRVYMGVHFPLDTAAGAVVAVVSVSSVLLICRVRRKSSGRKE